MLSHLAGADFNNAPAAGQANLTGSGMINTGINTIGSMLDPNLFKSPGSSAPTGTGSTSTTNVSDVRLKKNLKKVGKTPRGTNIYEFDWVTGGHNVGVLAQEVLHIPGAAILGDDGFYRVDYSKV